jgi:hypothetical protein
MASSFGSLPSILDARSAVRLNIDSVSLILQACFGGKEYNVTHLSGWMFKFSISCKNVAFMINNLKSHSFKTFLIFFHLWSGGGPNWRKDFTLWQQEQDAKWNLVGSKSKKSYADIAKSNIKKSVLLRLSYPTNYASNFLEPPRRASLAPDRFSHRPAQNNVMKAQIDSKPVKGLQQSHPSGFPRWVKKNNAKMQETVMAMSSVSNSKFPLF